MAAVAPIVPLAVYGLAREVTKELYPVQAGTGNTLLGVIRHGVGFTLDHLRIQMDADQTGTVTLHVVKIPDTIDISAAVADPAVAGSVSLGSVVLGTHWSTNGQVQTAVSIDALTALQRYVAGSDRIVVIAAAADAWTTTGLTVVVVGRTTRA